MTLKERRQPENRGLRLSFQLLWWEGAFATAYDAWIGPIYLSGLAGELGLSIGMATLLAAMPWVGSLGPLVGAWIHGARRDCSPRASTLLFAAVSRALWLVPLLLAGYWTVTGPARGLPFPAERWFHVTAAIACLAALAGSSSGATWMSWLRALIPARFRGRFFAVRNRYVMVATVAAHFLAAAWIAWKPGGFYLGYGALGLLAVGSAALSTFLLAKVADSPSSPPPRRPAARDFTEPFRDPEFRGVLLFGAAFQGALQLASPFYPFYFTRDLGIPMSLVASWVVIGSVGSFVAAGFWGKRIDRKGDASGVLGVAAVLSALCPLPYVFASAEVVRWMAPFDYFTNGLYWVGYQLAISTLLLQRTPHGRNVVYFSVFTACSGAMAAIGTLAGGWLASALAPWGGFRALWLIASVARFAVIIFLLRGVVAREGRKEAAPAAGAVA